MPWTETWTDEEKLRSITEWLAGEESKSSLCARCVPSCTRRPLGWRRRAAPWRGGGACFLAAGDRVFRVSNG
jgi:hypothetical protein